MQSAIGLNMDIMMTVCSCACVYVRVYVCMSLCVCVCVVCFPSLPRVCFHFPGSVHSLLYFRSSVSLHSPSGGPMCVKLGGRCVGSGVTVL